MRRLPIYFLIDVSESMVGEPIAQVEKGLETIIQDLRTDPRAQETVYISIVVFAGKAKTIMPLQEINNFYPPKFPIGSGTSLTAGLRHLSDELDANIVRTTQDTKGDWKPIIFLLTDGVPTDDTSSAITRWKHKWQRSSNLVAVTLGNNSDTALLSQLSENIISVEDSQPGAFKAFFDWVTASIKVSSTAIEDKGTDFELAPIRDKGMSPIDLAKAVAEERAVDDNYIVLTGKCMNVGRPYLIKYKRQDRISDLAGMNINTGGYHLVGGFPITEEYFDLSDGLGTGQQVNTNMLSGTPSCPCCANPYSFALCQCGGLHCMDNSGSAQCPWCNNIGHYNASGGGLSVERSQG